MSPSHLSPVKPGGQLQRYPPTLSTQVPLFRHLGGALRSLGCGAQSSSLISQRTPLKGQGNYKLFVYMRNLFCCHVWLCKCIVVEVFKMNRKQLVSII